MKLYLFLLLMCFCCKFAGQTARLEEATKAPGPGQACLHPYRAQRSCTAAEQWRWCEVSLAVLALNCSYLWWVQSGTLQEAVLTLLRYRRNSLSWIPQACRPELSETSKEGWLSQAALAPGTGWGVQPLLYVSCSLLFCLTAEEGAISFIYLYFTICIGNDFCSDDSFLWYLLFYTTKISYFFSNWLFVRKSSQMLEKYWLIAI